MKKLKEIPKDNRLIILVYSDFTRQYIFAAEITSFINLIGWYNI